MLRVHASYVLARILCDTCTHFASDSRAHKVLRAASTDSLVFGFASGRFNLVMMPLSLSGSPNWETGFNGFAVLIRDCDIKVYHSYIL